MALKVVIRIPRRLPTLNELRKKYKHHMDYKRLRDGWQRDIATVMGAPMSSRLRAEVAGHKARLRITSFRKSLADMDGCTGGAKPVIDAIVRNGYMVDDSPQWVDLEVRQEKSGIEETEIEIEVLP